MKTVMKVRRQILVDGKNIHSASRETGIANMIHKYLKEGSPPAYQRHQAVKQFQPDYSIYLLPIATAMTNYEVAQEVTYEGVD